MNRHYFKAGMRVLHSSSEKSVIFRPRRIALFASACLIVGLCWQLDSAKPKRRIPQGAIQEDRGTKRERTANLVTQYSLNEKTSDANGLQIREHLQQIVTRPNVKLFLGVIKKAEAGKPNLMVGGCRAYSLRQHPATTLPKRCRYPIRINGRRTFSTASGNYQLTLSNWRRIAPFLGLRSFSENNQALAALELIRRGGGAAGARTSKGLSLRKRIQTGFVDLLKGNVKKALCLATYDWASSQCSPLPANHKVDYARLLRSVERRDSNSK